ncbi:MAG: universal stress protein [Solidesulfovibrio sp.]|jgi:nucleotide-binding universal stress UspA family protein|uniref:universal stress protein n=1 Tax=Solidesulfovibrio sp. TaxID=2910990 RepID=UPI0031584599
MRRILLGSDGSRQARQAEDRVISLAKGGDSIVALHVVPTDLMHYGLVDQLATQSDKEEFLRYIRELGERECLDKLSGFLARARERGVDARLSVRWGEPLREILAAAVESAADEVFLPSHGWGVDFTVPEFVARINRSSPCKITILA